MKTRNIVTIVAAVIGGAYAVYRFGTSTFGLLSGVNVAVIIEVAGLFAGRTLDAQDEKSQGYVVKDERTLSLEGKASTAGFKIGNYVWLALVWYEFFAENFMPWPRIGSPPVLLLGLLLNLGVYAGAYRYYWKRV